MSAVTLSSWIKMVKMNSAHLRVTFLYVRLKIYIVALFIIDIITKTSNTRISESI